MIFFGICFVTATKLVNQYHLQKWFVSIPYTTTILIVPISYILYHLFHIELTLPFFMQRLAVTIFLFSIGYQIAAIMNKKYLIRLLILSVISILIITLLNLITIPLPEYHQIIFGSAMFAFSPFIMEYVTLNRNTDFLLYWSSIQMIIVFMCTPVFLLLSNRILFRKLKKERIDNVQEIISVPFTRLNLFVIALSSIFVLLTIKLHFFNFLFLHDFVFGLLSGFLLGIVSKYYDLQNEKATQLHQFGSLGLYIFIVATINQVSFVHHELFSWSILSLIVLKTLFVGFVSVLVMMYFFKSLTIEEKLVATVAGWTFILNAPVVCMHGMRTVVNRYGPAPYVLLIIPPIILWFVNYLHILLTFVF
jgi:hypothetical protein